MIEARGLTLGWSGQPVLRDVSLTLARGELVGLIGPPESGKTVLLKVLAGLVDPDAGEIWADGARVDHLDDAARAGWQRRIGMSFQNDALFDALSVADNVAFPLARRGVPEREREARVAAALERVGLADAAVKLPAEISGGMRKRVGIARAAVVEPELGLFDEPIAGLDPVAAARILSLIVELGRAGAMATLVVTNDLPVLLPVLDRVVMLVAGEKVFDGPTAELEQSTRPEVRQFVTGADEGPL